MTISPFPFVSVTGPARLRGLEYGRQAQERIHKSVALYQQRLRDKGLRDDDLLALVRSYLPLISNFDSDFLDEMKGIAEGAGLPFEKIVMINARTEVLARAERLHEAKEEHQQDGCTGVVVLPEVSATERLIHAQNWDWIAECAETGIVLKVEPDRGPSFLTFTEAGGLARSGLNSQGIGITANYLESDRDFNRDGVPLSLIRRKVLQQDHLALAMAAVTGTEKTVSNNIIISHKDGFAVDFECAPDESFKLYPDDGLIVHANHWQSEVALCKLKEQNLDDWSDSYYRDWRVRRHLEKQALVTVEDVKAALADDFGYPYSVCRPAVATDKGLSSATVATLVMDPCLGTMEVAPLPPEGITFTTYQLYG